MARLSKPVVAVALVGLGALMLNCSAILDLEGNQCASDAQCTKYNDKGTRYACVSGGCVPAKADSGVAPPTEIKSCATNQECGAAGGALTSICRDSKCVSVTSPDCGEVIGNLNDTDALVVGVMYSQLAPAGQAGFASAVKAALIQARLDFTGAAVPRAVSFALCDETSNATRAARHLVDDLKVPAILLAGTSENAQTVVDIVGGNVALFTSTLGSDGTFTRSVPNDARTAAAMVLAAGIVNRPAADPWVLLQRNDPSSQAVAKAASGLAASPTVYQPNDGSAALAVGKAAKAIAFSGAYEIPSLIVEIEKAGLKPFYLLPPGAMTTDLLSVVQAGGDLADRIAGVVPLDSPTGASFAALGVADTTYANSFGFAQTYDAYYALSFAGSTLSKTAPPTGAAMLMGFASLAKAGGTKIPVGKGTIPAALNGISMGGIDLDGASGPLDFTQQGTVESNYQLWCVENGKFTYSGRVVDATGKLNAAPATACTKVFQ